MTVKWKTKNGLIINFTTKEVWKGFKEDTLIVKWWKDVWFSFCNPRFAFILWLAINRRLQTQDRMMKWNPSQMLCPLCNKINDSHTHLFFQCDFSMAIWRYMKKKMSINNVPDAWDSVIRMMEDMQCNNTILSVLNNSKCQRY